MKGSNGSQSAIGIDLWSLTEPSHDVDRWSRIGIETAWRERRTDERSGIVIAWLTGNDVPVILTLISMPYELPDFATSFVNHVENGIDDDVHRIEIDDDRRIEIVDVSRHRIDDYHRRIVSGGFYRVRHDGHCYDDDGHRFDHRYEIGFVGHHFDSGGHLLCGILWDLCLSWKLAIFDRQQQTGRQ